MNTLTDFKEVFVEKLKSTGSFEEAFAKAIWIAYNQGLLDGLEDKRANRDNAIAAVKDIVGQARSKVLLTRSQIEK